MTKTPELDVFIKDSVKAGKSPDEIRAILSEAGWDEKRLNAAFEYYYPADYPVAVPRPKVFASPRLFFLNLFYFLLFYLVTYNVVSIIFTMLDHYLPDGLGNYNGFYYYSGNISRAIQDSLAIIIVCAPMIYVSSRTITKAMHNARQSIPRIRLILVYLTLFVGACVILSSGCLFVYYFLRGELSMRFIIKIAILTAMVIGLYMYYRGELKRDEENA